MPGPDNFNSGFLWGKKDVQTDYVSITPEQQAEIDKANANAEAARNSEALQQGLSNKQPDLDKGVVCERSNLPLLTEEQVLANQGEIRQADPWIVRTFNNGEYHVKNFLKELGISIVGGALLVGKGALMSLGVILSCSKEEPMSPPDAGVGLKVTDEMFAQWVINYLGETEHQTPDGLGYKYYFDDETKKPYAEFDNKFKHFIGDDLSFKEDGAMKTMYDILGNLPLINKDEVTEKGIIATLITTADLANGNQGGSYDLQNPGFTMELIPCDLKEVTSGSPELKITIGEDVIQGKPEVVSAGDFKVFSNGQEKDCSSNAICIKDSDGKPTMLLQFEKNFEEYYGNKFDGVVVYVPDDAGKLTEKYLMSEITDTETMIQHINRETQPAGQWYTTTIQKFDANGIDEEYDEAYKYIEAQANADVDIY